MPQPYDYVGLMGGADSGRVLPAVQSALLGQQNIDQNNNLLAQQQMQLDQARRADAARQAQAQIVSDPHIDDAMFEQLLVPIAQFDPSAAQSMRQQRAMSLDLTNVISNPNARSIGEFSMRYPDVGKQVSQAFETMSEGERDSAFRTASDVYGYLQAGDRDGAAKVLRAHVDADKRAGMDVTAYEPLIDLIAKDPNRAMFVAGTLMASHVGPDKFAEAFKSVGEGRRADELQPSEVALKQTEAKYAPITAESNLATAQASREKMAADIVRDRENTRIAQGRLALDTEALATNTQLKLAELEQSGTNLSPQGQQLVNEAAGNSAEAQTASAKFNDLAGRIDGAQLGAYGSWKERFKGLAGSQDAVTQLRAEYAQLRNQAALLGRKNMPGAMSDADRDFLLKGFPSDNANGAYVAKFLRTMAKAQDAIAANEDGKARWVSQNGTLGPSRRPFVIEGMRVPAGMSYSQYQAAMAKIRPHDLPGDAQGVIDRARQQ